MSILIVNLASLRIREGIVSFGNLDKSLMCGLVASVLCVSVLVLEAEDHSGGLTDSCRDDVSYSKCDRHALYPDRKQIYQYLRACRNLRRIVSTVISKKEEMRVGRASRLKNVCGFRPVYLEDDLINQPSV